MTEIDLLKEQLAAVKAENNRLRLQLNNANLLCRKMMIEAGKLPKPDQKNGDPILN